MIRIFEADGTWRDLTDEQFIAEFGEDEFREFEVPEIAEADMTEGQKYLASKMQSEHGVNAAAGRAGIGSIFVLPSEFRPDKMLRETAKAGKAAGREKPDTDGRKNDDGVGKAAQSLPLDPRSE